MRIRRIALTHVRSFIARRNRHGVASHAVRRTSTEVRHHEFYPAPPNADGSRTQTVTASCEPRRGVAKHTTPATASCNLASRSAYRAAFPPWLCAIRNREQSGVDSMPCVACDASSVPIRSGRKPHFDPTIQSDVLRLCRQIPAVLPGRVLKTHLSKPSRAPRYSGLA